MEISINKYQVETVEWQRLEAGELFKDPNQEDSYLYMKTDEGESVNLLTGCITNEFSLDDDVIDVTDKYKIVDK